MLRADLHLTMEDDAATVAIVKLLNKMSSRTGGTLSTSEGALRRLAETMISIDDMVHLRKVFPSLAATAAEGDPDLAPEIREVAVEVARALSGNVPGEIILSRRTINLLETFGMTMNKKGDDNE